ncbi:ABC transporter substrate-binding protein [Bradyrhizobium sp.]|uniref:ABC transporter substrate-binding protein n=1 Tax=Bradyrhizobium sp. TaxID=376 RepID=UPI003C37530E
MRIRKSTIVVLGAFLAFVLIVPTLAATPVKIGYTASTDSVALYVGQKEGFFKKHGLDVQLQLIALNSTLPAAVQSDSVQIAGPSTPIVLQAIEGGLDLVAAAGGASTSKTATNYAIVVKADKAISKPRDFVGKRVGVPGFGATLHILFREWLDRNGVDYKQVKFVETPFSQMNDILKAGTVDAVISADPMTTRIVQAKTGTVLSYFVQDFPEGMPTSVYVTTRKWAEANPDAVKAFREAIAESAAFAISHPEAAKRAVGEYLKYPPEILANVYLPPVVAEVTPERLDTWIQIMLRQELLSKKPDPVAFIAH